MRRLESIVDECSEAYRVGKFAGYAEGVALMLALRPAHLLRTPPESLWLLSVRPVRVGS